MSSKTVIDVKVIKATDKDFGGVCVPLITLDSMNEVPNSETQEAMKEALTYDFSEMRTHRLPEDDEGMTEENQKPSRMPKALLDQLNGVTPENPEGVRQLVSVRLHNKVVDKLKAHGKTVNMGHQTLIIDILEKFVESK